MKTFPAATCSPGFTLVEVLLALLMAGLLLYVTSVSLPTILRAEASSLESSRLTLLGQRLFTDYRLAASGALDPSRAEAAGPLVLRHEVAEVTEGKTVWKVYSAWPESAPSHMMQMAFPVTAEE